MQLVPLRYVEQPERHFVPAGQMDAIEASATTERQDVVRSPEDGHMGVELLVWLEIANGTT